MPGSRPEENEAAATPAAEAPVEEIGPPQPADNKSAPRRKTSPNNGPRSNSKGSKGPKGKSTGPSSRKGPPEQGGGKGESSGKRSGKGKRHGPPDDAAATRDQTAPNLDLAELQSMDMTVLTKMGLELSIEGVGSLTKHELIFEILKANARKV